ncbi:MAG: hypothetical protein K2X77_17125 [Candidatus Obscuribacterales bacterium]|jgi:hypothetical protein|nr:hypothetical protein [Candidatus Obscuribacterales bacterium]
MENHYERRQSVFESIASTIWGWIFIFVVFALIVVWSRSTVEISPATEEKLVPGLKHTAPSSKE